MPRMGKFPPFGKRFFRRARKLIGSCQFEHLWRIVALLASLQEGRSLSKFEDATGVRRSRQAISNFLTLADWNAPSCCGKPRSTNSNSWAFDQATPSIWCSTTRRSANVAS